MTKDTPTLDLCKRHRREAYKIFKRRGVTRLGVKNKRKGVSKKERYKEMWDKRKQVVLDVLKGGPLSASEFHKATKMPKHLLQRTTEFLVAQKKIKREGWSKGTRWSLT